MHEKRFKINFFENFRKLQKKLPICKKRYAEILNTARAVVTIVEKKVKRVDRIFFGSHLEEQSVVKWRDCQYGPIFFVVCALVVFSGKGHHLNKRICKLQMVVF